MTGTARFPRNTRIAILGTLLLMVAVVVIFSSGANVISKPLVESHLKAFAERVAKEAKANGTEASFTYKDVHVEGFLFNKRAVISEPVFTFTESSPFRQRSVTLTTPEAIASADKVSGRNLIVQFPHPLGLTEGGQLKTTVTFDEPPAYMFSREPFGKMENASHMLMLPSKFTVAQAATAGAEAKQYIVTYDAKPVILTKSDRDGKTETQFKMNHLSIMDSSTQGVVTIAAINSIIKHMPGDNQADNFDAVVAVDNIRLTANDKESGPYAIKLSMNGVTSQPVANAPQSKPVARMMTPSTMDSNITLRELAFDAANYGVLANGTINQKAGEPYPYGNVEVKITNVAQALQADGMTAETKTLLSAILQAITGQPVSQQKDAQFVIKREQGGSFMIGQVTFEQLVGYILPQLVMPNGQAAPALPGSIPGGVPAPAISTPSVTDLPAPSQPAAPQPAAPQPAVNP